MTNQTTAVQLQRKLWGVALIGAPLLSGLSSLVRFAGDAQFATGLAQTYAFILMIVSVLGIANLMRDRAPYLSVFGGALALLGAVGGVNYGTALVFQSVAARSGISDTANATITSMMEYDAWPVLNLPGLIFPFSLLILSIGLFRTRSVPTWVAISMVLGAIAFPLGRAIELQIFYLLSDLFLLIPFAYIGLQYISSPKPSYAPTIAALQPSQK